MTQSNKPSIESAPMTQDALSQTDSVHSILNLSVRSLIFATCRAGDLSNQTFGTWDKALTGTRIHHAFAKAIKERFKDQTILSEQTLSTTIQTETLNIHLSGRADLIMLGDITCQTSDETILKTDRMVIEVKTTFNPLSQLPTQGHDIHWHQSQCYAYMDALKVGKLPTDLITYALAYVSSEDLKSTFIYRQQTLSEMKAAIDAVVKAYLEIGQKKALYLKQRNHTISQLKFPYPKMREGQSIFIKTVLHHILHRTNLMVEAPTGLGKTISTLFPAVKALGHRQIDRIYYVTAKTTAREVAHQALQDMRHAGLYLKSIVLTAKETICFCPDIFCDTHLCEYANGYYNRLPAALSDLSGIQAYTRSIIETVAKKHQLCPFELSLDVCESCDVIIGDYNHVFDPRAKLIQTLDKRERSTWLIDEAHNLPSRARSMYTAGLSYSEILDAQSALETLDPAYREIIEPLRTYFVLGIQEILQDAYDDSDPNQYGLMFDSDQCHPVWDLLEPNAKFNRNFIGMHFRAALSRSPRLCQILHHMIIRLRPILDRFEDFELKRKVMNLFFDAQLYIRVCDEYWHEHYILTLSKEPDGEWWIHQRCLDVVKPLNKQGSKHHHRIFFSATFSPIDFYGKTLCGVCEHQEPDYLALNSPFDPDHLQVAIYPLSTTQQNRTMTADKLVQIILEILETRQENILIYFPSYAYMESIYREIRSEVDVNDCMLLLQRRNMSEAQRSKFVMAFDRAEQIGKQVIGFAVMGGIFSEGIDLLGDRLGGVICIGTGLSSLNVEHDMLSFNYQAQSLPGFAYAYQYPGFNRVMQAAGRLIRSETDRGFLLLIDERYTKPDYYSIFPIWWQPKLIQSAEQFSYWLNVTIEKSRIDPILSNNRSTAQRESFTHKKKDAEPVNLFDLNHITDDFDDFFNDPENNFD